VEEMSRTISLGSSLLNSVNCSRVSDEYCEWIESRDVDQLQACVETVRKVIWENGDQEIAFVSLSHQSQMTPRIEEDISIY